MATHYRLKSATTVGGTVRMAGSVITAEEFATLSEVAQELFLRDEHLVECDGPATPAPIPSPFPRKRGPKPT